MNDHWMMKTNGDPIEALNRFVKFLWKKENLEGLLVSSDDPQAPHILRDPEQLAGINPFRPVMALNTARLIPKLQPSTAGAKWGALLRPCEMRAWIEMTKHKSMQTSHLVTICVDCLGTYPLDDFGWRAERKGSVEGLAKETLQFAHVGGIATFRYRPACQMCTSPGASGADFDIGVIGLPVRQHVMISTRDESVSNRIQINEIAASRTDESSISQRQHTIGKVIERNSNTRQRVVEGLTTHLPKDLDALMKQFDSCGDCQNCMKVCPICSVDFPVRELTGRYTRAELARWLVSCAGCGMCEQVCSNHLPLTAIFGYIRQQLGEQYGYRPGAAYADSLPVH